MKRRKIHTIILLLMVILFLVLLFVNRSSTQEKSMVKEMFPKAQKIEEIKELSKEPLIEKNFPAVLKGYKVDGKPAAFITRTMGYKGEIILLVSIDAKKEAIKEIKIISHQDTPQYADPIKEEWFTKRFQNITLGRYLKLAILGKEVPEDIIQVTGATVTSQGVLNGVNGAMGAWQYLSHGKQMPPVPVSVPAQMLESDENSFAINWPGGSIRITSEDLEKYPMVKVDAVLQKTTGTKSNETVEGPLLEELLKEEGIHLDDYEGIGVSGRDGYYTMVDKEKLKGQAILGIRFNEKPIKEEEKPIRFVMPDQMGPYWVKMVSSIDLYDEISPKNIQRVHMFDALTRDIEPYYYEYYGSKDKSIEIGKILAKFPKLDLKGFFTMTSVDGLEKNETLSLVRERYFIKVEGENAPMNIAPKFKLGMNVKNISHFSTTLDAAVFPDKIKEVCRTKEIGGEEAMKLEDVLVATGLLWKDDETLHCVDTKGGEVALNAKDILNAYLTYHQGQVTLWNQQEQIMTDLLTVEKR